MQEKCIRETGQIATEHKDKGRPKYKKKKKKSLAGPKTENNFVWPKISVVLYIKL